MSLVHSRSQALVDLLRRYDRHELSEDAAGAFVAEHAADFSGDDFFFLLTEEPQVALVVLRDLREVSSTGLRASGETAPGLVRAHAQILLLEAERIYLSLTEEEEYDDFGFGDEDACDDAYDDLDSLCESSDDACGVNACEPRRRPRCP